MHFVSRCLWGVSEIMMPMCVEPAKEKSLMGAGGGVDRPNGDLWKDAVLLCWATRLGT